MRKMVSIAMFVAMLLALVPAAASAAVEGGIPSDVTQCEAPKNIGDDGHFFGDVPGICFNVQGDFWYYWRSHGLDLGDEGVSFRESLALFGYPITRAFEEKFEDGTTMWVQYFERARFEIHPENQGTEFYVLLGHFGRDVLGLYPELDGAAQRVNERPNEHTRYFPETGHHLSGDFLFFWEGNGGLMVFGYPLTEPTEQKFADGTTLWVQYFERARFELHPKNQGTPYYVQLGHFGRTVLDMRMGKGGGTKPGSCDPAIATFNSEQDKPWDLGYTEGPSVLGGFWSNWENLGTTDVKVFVPAGTPLVLKGGGTILMFGPGCEQAARDYMKTLQFPEWTVDQLRAKGYVVETAPPPPPGGGGCAVLHEYQLKDLTEISSFSSLIHVQFWVEGQPERETVLPAGRYPIANPGALKGMVWEYVPECDVNGALADTKASIARRQEVGANTAGYVHWTYLTNNGLISVGWQQQPVPNIPSVLP